jgi:hypothetical protein
MKSNDGLQNLTGNQPSAGLPPGPVNQFDRELVGWFAQHEGVWSGTAGELLAAITPKADVSNDLWPQSQHALYAHLESHEQILRSSGLAVLLPRGVPRMILLRSCRDEQPARETLSGINAAFSQASQAQSDGNGNNPESVSENADEAFLAMLRKSASPPSKPSTSAKLAAAPTYLWSTVKKTWTKHKTGT